MNNSLGILRFVSTINLNAKNAHTKKEKSVKKKINYHAYV
jgi:hypothetical protein